ATEGRRGHFRLRLWIWHKRSVLPNSLARKRVIGLHCTRAHTRVSAAVRPKNAFLRKCLSLPIVPLPVKLSWQGIANAALYRSGSSPFVAPRRNNSKPQTPTIKAPHPRSPATSPCPDANRAATTRTAAVSNRIAPINIRIIASPALATATPVPLRAHPSRLPATGQAVRPPPCQTLRVS